MKGKIDKIVEKEGENGPYFAVCVSDEWYTSFEDMSEFQEGDRVKFEIKERKANGNVYRNITQIEKIENSGKKTDREKRIEKYHNEKVSGKIKGLALKKAVDLVKETELELDTKMKKSLEIAKYFEKEYLAK